MRCTAGVIMASRRAEVVHKKHDELHYLVVVGACIAVAIVVVYTDCIAVHCTMFDSVYYIYLYVKIIL